MGNLKHVLLSAFLTTGCLKPSGSVPHSHVRASLIEPDEPAARLEDTGLFASLAPLRPAAGVMGYAVKSAFWSDGSGKRRFILVPPGARLSFDAEAERFVFPAGTVLIKHFDHPDDEAVPVETRLLFLKADNKWAQATYRWVTPYQTELVKDITVMQDETGQVTYRIPSEKECQLCHYEGTGVILGFTPEQLNFKQEDGQTEVLRLAKEKLFNASLAELTQVRPIDHPDDETLLLASRARAYLHQNCSFCHRPEGVMPVMDMRQETPLEESNLLGAYVAPGNLDGSIVWEKISTTDHTERMPPTSVRADPTALGVVKEWILNLK